MTREREVPSKCSRQQVSLIKRGKVGMWLKAWVVGIEMNLTARRRENQQKINNQKESQGWWPNSAWALECTRWTNVVRQVSRKEKDLVLVYISDWKVSASFPGYSPTGTHNVYIYFLCLPRLGSVVTQRKKSHNQLQDSLDITFYK